jgi:hypothetical protein
MIYDDRLACDLNDGNESDGLFVATWQLLGLLVENPHGKTFKKKGILNFGTAGFPQVAIDPVTPSLGVMPIKRFLTNQAGGTSWNRWKTSRQKRFSDGHPHRVEPMADPSLGSETQSQSFEAADITACENERISTS